MNLFNTDRFLDGCWQISTALSAAKMRMSPTNVGIGRVKRQSIEPVLAARKIELICLIMPHGMESKSTNRCTKHHGGNCQPPSSTRFHHSPRVIPPHTQLWGYHHFQKVLFLWFSGSLTSKRAKFCLSFWQGPCSTPNRLDLNHFYSYWEPLQMSNFFANESRSNF